MEGGAIVRLTTIFYSFVYRHLLMKICIISSKTLYIEKDPHQGSKHLHM